MPIPKNEKDAEHILKVIDDALALGWTISVSDGESWTLRKSSNRGEILDAICTTDEDRLSFWDAQIHLGLLYCIYGEPDGDGIFTDWQAVPRLNQFLEDIMGHFFPNMEVMKD